MVARLVLLSLWVLFPLSVKAFSLLGPVKNQANNASDPWQGRGYAGRPWGLGYELDGDIGGPMFLDEAYRWNVPTIYYGFDASFLDYFGVDGVVAVEKAMTTLNALPAASDLTGDLSNFPFETLRQNFEAESLQLLDLKSWILAAMLEQLGLANPERFVSGLRQRTSDPECSWNPDCGSLVMLNYDPVELKPSYFVNGSLYHWLIVDEIGPKSFSWASAVEWYQLDPERIAFSSVAGGLGNPDGFIDSGDGQRLRPGNYYTGLTRDDVGGLRYLLNRDRRVREALFPDVSGAGQGDIVREALRGGIDKLRLKNLPWDANRRSFTPATEFYADVFYTSADGGAITQLVQRVVTSPDILFCAEDLGGTLVFNPSEHNQPAFIPKVLTRGALNHWRNNSAVNESSDGGGPGVITPGGVITLNKLGRYWANGGGIQWGSFDDSDGPPAVLVGSETNHAAVILQTRVVLTNDVPHIEWSALLSRDWSQRYFRVEESSDLTVWHAIEWIDTAGLNPPIVTRRFPTVGDGRLFRILKASGPGE